MFIETTLTTDRIEAARAPGAWPDERIRDALLVRGFGYVSMHKEIRGELDFIDEIVVVGDRQADTYGWDDVELGRQSGIEETTLDLLTSDCNEVSEIIFTSGTTGQPKGVLHTINTLAAGVQGILPNFTKGSEEIVHMDVWDPVVFADLIESRGITASAGAAPFLADLLGVPGLEDRNLSSFTMFGCFGSAIPLPLLEDAAERLPCAVMPGWGMSEISLMTTTTLTDSIDKISGTDGAPLKGNKIRVVDESGRTLT
jgi:cyclohexanecarboxylate-CoA ligase